MYSHVDIRRSYPETEADAASTLHGLHDLYGTLYRALQFQRAAVYGARLSGAVPRWCPSLFRLTSALLADLEQTLQCTTELKQKDRVILFFLQDSALASGQFCREDSVLSLTSVHVCGNWHNSLHSTTNIFRMVNVHIQGVTERWGQTLATSSIYKNKKFWEELIAYFPWYDTDHIENDAFNNSSIVAFVFFTAVTFLPSRCLQW
jgi:hypothetical protein